MKKPGKIKPSSKSIAVNATIDELLKIAQTKKEEQLIKVEQKKSLNEDDRVLIAKLEVLRCLLLGEIIDESKSIPGCDPIMLNLFNEGELYTVKGKVMELIKKL